MAPSQLALDQAARIKAYRRTQASDADVTPAEQWFRYTPLNNVRHVSYTSIAFHADREYLKWRTPRETTAVEYECDYQSNLDAFVAGCEDAKLAAFLDATPRGLAADPDTGVSFDFSPWQRFWIAHYVHGFVDVSSSVRVSELGIVQLAGPGASRRIPIVAQMTLTRGATPDVCIVDTPTATGKTSLPLAAAATLVLPSNIPRLLREQRQKSKGCIVEGTLQRRVAPVVLVATAAATFDHFVTTARRLVPRLLDVDEELRGVQVWHQVGKKCSLDVAASLPEGEIVLWIVPVTKLMAVLRAHPDVAVPVVATDEYTVDTPRERFVSAQSPVFKQIVMQATPQALQEATERGRTWLRDFFEGPLSAPRKIPSLVQNRTYNQAALAARQLVRLDLVASTPFRAPVREDMRSLLPVGVDVHFLPSRRVTFRSYLANSASDLVPASLCDVMLRYLSPFRPDAESVDMLKVATQGEAVTAASLNALLDGMTSCHPGTPDTACKDRLKQRLAEFQQHCPICYKDTDDAAPLKMCGTCGYCVCDECHAACRRDTCAFCRNPMRSLVPRAAAAAGAEGADAAAGAEGADAAAGADDERIPNPPSEWPDAWDPSPFASNMQFANVAIAMYYLRHRGCKRVLFVCEQHVRAQAASAIAARTAVEIVCVDGMLTGKGTAFASVKRRFDAPNPAPLALLTSGVDADAFLVGTDLAAADAMLIVGDVPDRLLTQAMGRVFRPNARRDNSKAVVMMRVMVR